MNLRPYQQAALDAALSSLKTGSNPVLQLATGTGKSVIIAALAEHYRLEGRRAWMLTHVQQLVKQNAATYARYANAEAAIVCASLGRKDAGGDVTYGTIQSMTGMLDALEPPDLIIIDEAHRVPHNEGEPTLYESVLGRYPDAQRVAMTATPWRMDNGVIHGTGSQFWFDTLAYAYTVPRAVADGWLCPLVGVETEIQLNVDEVLVNGDFVQAEVAAAMSKTWLNAVARSMLKLADKRQHIGVYCPTVKAAEVVAGIINRETGWSVGVLHSGLAPHERNAVLDQFMSGEVRVLCSVDMITTGFDFPALDCIVCLRPTLSSSLWVQIQGRGTRLHPSKKNCLVLDYAGNLIRLGGVDMYETFYRETGLVEVDAAEPRKPYVKKERKVHPGMRSLKPIDPMTGKEAQEGSEFEVAVHFINAVAITPRNASEPALLVRYACTTQEGARIDASVFLNTHRPDRKTLEFFSSRMLAIHLPAPAKSISWQLKNARQPKTVMVRKRGKYWNVVGENWG